MLGPGVNTSPNATMAIPITAAVTVSPSPDPPRGARANIKMLALLGAAAAQIVDRAQGVAQLGQPLLAVPADQLDAPGQGLGAGTGDTRVDEGVQHFALLLAQAGHHGRRMRGEQRPRPAALRPPRNLALVAVL